MSITIVGGGNPSGPTFPVQRSVRLRSSATAYFSRTPASAGNRQIFTYSVWLKRGALGSRMSILDAYASSAGHVIEFQASDVLEFYSWGTGPAVMDIITSQVFRDSSSFYHIVVAVDTTQATASNRVKMYVNGVQITSFSTATYPAQNSSLYIDNNIVHDIGRRGDAQFYYDGYLTEVNFIDGQALTPTSFGAYNSYGVWSPAKYTGTYGTNGFYLNFQDNSAATAAAIGKDSSGNGNNWTPNNISVTAGVTYDSMLDVPTLTSSTNANFATLNPLANSSTLLNGNLTTNAGDKWSISTIGMTSGKWYCEVTVTTVGAESSMGISTQPFSGAASIVGGTSTSWGYYSINGNKYTNNSASSYGATYTSGDIIGIAFDADNGSLTFYKNNTTQGTAFTGLTSGPYFFALEGRTSTTANNCSINFGQRPFTYTPPTGFKRLNTYNLPAPTIPNGAAYMAATTYTGNGGSGQVVTNTVNGTSFQPDFAWIKSRSNIDNNQLVDSVRGLSGTPGLSSNLTSAEFATGIVTAFNSNGFTSATGTTQNYISWQWKANGTPAVTNTSGSIPSTISANTTAGFSIVTYTGNGSAGATVGHGLGIAPKMIILKNRSNATGYSWPVMHASLPSNGNVFLNLTQAYQTTYTTGGIANPANSSTFGFTTTSTLEQVNANTNTYVAYCFSEIAGYSKFGSYTGNGSTNGPFVYTGFRPRWIMFKCTTAAENWELVDTSRNPYNAGTDQWLYPNLSNAEGTTSAGASTDILSNGFKLRGFTGTPNTSGATYIYAAFAENPFNYSLAR